MEKISPGIFALLMAIAFTTFSAFSNHRLSTRSTDPTVRFVSGGWWSSSDELLGDAIISSGCPNGTASVCGEFYEIDHLNFNNGEITVKNIPGTSAKYPPNLTLKYEE